MIFVVDVDAARAALRTGLLRCPDCTGRLGPWASARPRRLRGPGDATVQLTPDRARCRGCRRTHVVLPADVLPRRGYTAAAVLAALHGEHTIPATTVRGWRRALTRGHAFLTGQAIEIASAFGVAAYDERTLFRPPPSPLTGLLDVLGRAAHAVTTRLGAPAATTTTGPSGIDYLGLLAEQYRQWLCRRLRLADPEHAAALTPWAALTIVTAGQLLTAPAG